MLVSIEVDLKTTTKTRQLGEGVIIMEDINTPKPSCGTKLMLQWEEKGPIKIINDKEYHLPDRHGHQ